MVRSMTGFGSAAAERTPYAVRVELRSVNNRNLKFVTRLPERLLGLEAEVEKVLRRNLTRGTIQVSVQIEDSAGSAGYAVDATAAEAYLKQIAEVQERLGLGGQVDVNILLGLPGVVQKARESAEIPKGLWELVESALEEASQALVQMREEEGRFLWKEMVERTRIVEGLVEKVEARAPRMLEEYRDRLTKRLDQLLSKVGDAVKPEEIHREIALFTDKADITEELQRMRSHLAQLREAPDGGEPVGRKIEFILQEMFREANTMGSKANDPESIHFVVGIKSELEKLREQAYNVE